MIVIFLAFNTLLSLIVLYLLFTNKKDKSETASLERDIEKLQKSLREEMALNRMEISQKLNGFSESITSSMTKIAVLQRNQMDMFSSQIHILTESNDKKLDSMRETIENRLKLIQDDNNVKLEKMRNTVDEKLQSTLEQRLGESFKLVSERLELVHRGLGEMKNLAVGVGDLKKVLTNVKTRGIWGEVQLSNLLEQFLTEDQIERNVITKKGSNERVEFAIKIPSKDDDNRAILLPIDSKFPMEDYDRLLTAQEDGDSEKAEEEKKHIEIRIKAEAKDICDKYIDPPNTTDFGVLFLPVEGLYAEVLRIPGLCEKLQKDYRVIITGPTTLSALVNSLQMGFRTLAIEKRSSEVWQLLGAVKTEFVKFGLILDKTQKKIQEVSNTIETASRKSRNIERKLNKVQSLPEQESNNILDSYESEE